MPTPQTDTDRVARDRALAQEAAAGDARARRALADRLFERVRTTVRYAIGPDRDADDLVQLALIELLGAAGSFRGEARLETWADRITIRTVMRVIKRRRWREEKLRAETPADEGVSAGQDHQVARRQLRMHLARALQRLPDEQRIAVVLRLVHDYRVAEIAELTDSPINTVRERLRIGRQRLRSSVKKDPVLKDWAQWLGHVLDRQ